MFTLNGYFLIPNLVEHSFVEVYVKGSSVTKIFCQQDISLTPLTVLNNLDNSNRAYGSKRSFTEFNWNGERFLLPLKFYFLWDQTLTTLMGDPFGLINTLIYWLRMERWKTIELVPFSDPLLTIPKNYSQFHSFWLLNDSLLNPIPSKNPDFLRKIL